MLHRDFRLLDAQLRALKTGGDQVSGLPAIDRVVLYVDDLDRCPPAKVLEVLQAVHLLLALELFVVVVGVDPRWLERSLRHEYQDLLTDKDLDDEYLRTMPIEYLEKIFQIPFTLPSMEPPAYAKLIASLVPSIVASESNPPTIASTRRATPSDSPRGERAPTRGLLEVQPGSAASGAGGRPIDLTTAEVQFCQRLGSLVHTPRAAKRLLNTYRLIRATQHVGSRSRFLGSDGNPGEYVAVLTLLAITAGYPTIADRVLVALEEDSATKGIIRWSAFVLALDPGGGQRAPGSLEPPALLIQGTQDANRTEVATWTNLHGGLLAATTPSPLEDLEPYQRWARPVARFSFTL